MKTGELFLIAKQIAPAVTKRFFTKFYNMAIENLSEHIRLSVTETTGTLTAINAMMPTVIRVESIACDTSSYWSITDGVITLYDYDKLEMAATTTLTMRSWNRVVGSVIEANADGAIVDTIKPPNPPVVSIQAGVGLSDLKVVYGDVDTGFGLTVTHVVKVLAPVTIEGEDPLVYGDLISVTCSGVAVSYSRDISTIYRCDKYGNILNDTSIPKTELRAALPFVLPFGCIPLAYASDLWEEQDDGLEDMVQLAGTYRSLYEMGDIVGLGGEERKYCMDKYAGFERILRGRYNSTKSMHTTIRQVSSNA